MDNYHFIVNPIAGAGNSKRLFSEAKDIMDKELSRMTIRKS